MLNIGFSGRLKRTFQYNVARSIALYGASVWKYAIKTRINREKLIQLRRRSLLKITSAYWMMSADTLQEMTRQTLIDALIHETGKGHIDK